MKRAGLGVATATVALMGGGVAHAEVHPGDRWYVNAGPAQLTLADEATMAMGGAVIPGATYSSDPQTTVVVEIGRYISEHWAVSLTLGLPPTADADAAGAIAGLGRLGSATYGPVAVTAHYHFNEGGALRPYVGAGASYMIIFDTEDGVMSDLEVDHAFGPVLQAGATYQLNDRWSVYADVKQAYLETDASGTIGGAPVTAEMTFDPLVVSAGVGWRF